MRQQLRQGFVLIAVAAVVFCTRLGATRLWDDDETYFAQVAREMFERGDLVVPWFNQALFSHKPPFMYWMMIGAYHVFGVTEFAARLPSALFGIATVLLLWRLGRILYSPGVGFWAGIVLATSLNFVVIARAATCDAELIFFCTLPIYLFVRGTAAPRTRSEGTAALPAWSGENLRREPAWKTYAGIYAAMGMAVLVKGPIGFVLPAGVLGLFRLLRRTALEPSPAEAGHEGTSWRAGLKSAGLLFTPRRMAEALWTMRPLTAVAMVLLVSGPWFVLVSLKTQGEFLAGFFGVHHFHRFTSPMDNHSGPVWYYLAAICIGFFPWIIFLSPSVIELVRRTRAARGWQPADLLVASWFVVWVGFFSLASTKFPHYVVPAYPALALLTACFLDRWTRQPDVYGRLARASAWTTVAAAGLGILIVVPIVARIYLQEDHFVGWPGLALLAGAVGFAYSGARRQSRRALMSLTAGTVAFLTVLFGISARQVDRHQNTAPLADTIHRRAADQAPRIGTYRYFRPGLVYYCNDRVDLLPDRAAVTEFLSASGGPNFLVTTEAEYQQLAGDVPPHIEVLERSPWFLKSGQTLVLLGQISPAARGARQANAIPEREKTSRK